MNVFGCVRQRSLWASVMLVAAVIALAGFGGTARAQNEPATSEAEQKLEGLLKANNILFQKEHDPKAERYHFLVDFSVGSGETTRMLIDVVPRLTLPSGTKIYVVQAISVVAALPQGQKFSPAVTSAVAGASGKIYTGSYSTSENLVFANAGAYLMDMTPDGLFMMLFDLHANRSALAGQLKQVIAAEQLEN